MSSHHGCLQNPGQNPSPRGSPFPFAFRSVFKLPSETAKTRNRGSPDPACGPTARGGPGHSGKHRVTGTSRRMRPVCPRLFPQGRSAPFAGWDGKCPVLGVRGGHSHDASRNGHLGPPGGCWGTVGAAPCQPGAGARHRAIPAAWHHRFARCRRSNCSWARRQSSAQPLSEEITPDPRIDITP